MTMMLNRMLLLTPTSGRSSRRGRCCRCGGGGGAAGRSVLVVLGVLDDGGGDAFLEEAPTEDEVDFEGAIVLPLWFVGKAISNGNIILSPSSGRKHVIAVLTRRLRRPYRLFTRRTKPILVLRLSRSRGSVIITPTSSSSSSTRTSPAAGRPTTSPSSPPSPARGRIRVLVLLILLVLLIIEVRPGVLKIPTEVLGILPSRSPAAPPALVLVGLGGGTERCIAAAVAALAVVVRHDDS